MRHSPGEWRVLEAMGHRFVATPAYEGHPYFGCSRFVDIAGDEDYPLKDADLELIADAPKMLEALTGLLNPALPDAERNAARERARELVGRHSP